MRFFRLDGNTLKYYKNKNGGGALGKLQLDCNSICDCYDDSDPHTLHTFALVTQHRTLYMCAGNEKKKWDWIDEIRRHIKAASEAEKENNKRSSSSSNNSNSSNNSSNNNSNSSICNNNSNRV